MLPGLAGSAGETFCLGTRRPEKDEEEEKEKEGLSQPLRLQFDAQALADDAVLLHPALPRHLAIILR